MKSYVLLAGGCMLFVLGLIIGKSYVSQSSQPCDDSYLFVNPKLNCGNTQVISKANPIDLKAKLTTYIAEQKSAAHAEEISVYFRDLHDGPVMGIDENIEFISASLLKLPIAMTVYRLSEDDNKNKDILSRRLKYEEQNDPDTSVMQYFQPADPIRPDTFYSIEEYIYHSLVYSDNIANNVLKKALISLDSEGNLILETYQDLGLTLSASLNATDISTRLYGTIFRILYNASYLTVGHSEDILSMLAQSDFDTGIAAGVPGDIKVANKYGERTVGEQKQLHDCGIVYFPGNAYLLCVMTRGRNYDVLTGIISRISKIVYEDVNGKRLK